MALVVGLFIIVAIFPLPAGIAGVEPLMLGIFAASYVNGGIAGAAIICYRAISLGVQGALGAIALAMLATDLPGHPRTVNPREG